MSEVPLCTTCEALILVPEADLISQKVLIKSLCRSQIPFRSINWFSILVIVKHRLTGLCGN
jgi:hypothetical protein